jgi:hypothetical protein
MSAQVIDIRSRRSPNDAVPQAPDPVGVAYHEAGHAVMAAISPFHEVGDTVIATEDRGLTKSNGCSSFMRLKDNELWEIRIVLGGGAGERILNPKVDPFAYEDIFNPTAARLDIVFSGLELGNEEDPEEYCRREDQLIKGACRLLKKHELAVHKVALVLRTKGRISGDEVRAIVGSVRKVKTCR